MSDRDSLPESATGVILQKAIFSWQVAVTVIFTLLLFALEPMPFEFWQSWFWLLAGGATVAAFVVSNLQDPELQQEALSSMFERQYDLSEIKNPVSRERVSDAIEYRRNMMTLAARKQGSMRMQLNSTIDDIDNWISHMYNLALHIDSFESNELVERDLRSVPQQINKTQQRMDMETDPAVRRDLERQVENLQQQLANLQATQNSVKRAEIQLESTLSSLGTVYAQMSRLGAKEVDSTRAQRLRLEIQDEVSSLQDTIEAMDEVQAQSYTIR